MKISQLISDLKKIFDDHGDIPVKCQDGLDPSDLYEIDRIWVVDHPEKYVELCS